MVGARAEVVRPARKTKKCWPANSCNNVLSTLIFTLLIIVVILKLCDIAVNWIYSVHSLLISASPGHGSISICLEVERWERKCTRRSPINLSGAYFGPVEVVDLPEIPSFQEHRRLLTLIQVHSRTIRALVMSLLLCVGVVWGGGGLSEHCRAVCYIIQ